MPKMMKEYKYNIKEFVKNLEKLNKLMFIVYQNFRHFKYFRHFKFTIIILFTSGFAYAEGQQYQKVASLENNWVSLEDDWVVYDKKYAAYVPYIEKLHSNIKVISQTLKAPLNPRPPFGEDDVQRTSGQHYGRQGGFGVRGGLPFLISFFGVKNLCLFINHKLYFTSDKSKRYIFNIDSIASGNPESKSVFISFWHPDGDLPFKKIYHVIPKSPELYDTYTNSTAALLLDREKKPINNYLLIVTLILCVIYVLLKSRYSETFKSFYNINNVISPSNIEANILLNPVAGVNLYFMLAFCFLLSFVLQYIEYQNGIMTQSEYFNLHGSVYLFLLKFLENPWPVISLSVVAFFVFFILIIKYYLLLTISWLLKCRQFIKYHYLDTIRIVQILGLILFPLAAFLVYKYNISEGFILKFIFYSFIFFFGFILLRIIILINKLTSFRNLYLFSYLCATELIPSVVLIKLIL